MVEETQAVEKEVLRLRYDFEDFIVKDFIKKKDTSYKGDAIKQVVEEISDVFEKVFPI